MKRIVACATEQEARLLTALDKSTGEIARLQAECERLAKERDEYNAVAIEFRARFVTSFGAEAVSAHEKLKTAEAKLERMTKALSVATNIVMLHEPGDSRAVSDVAVALASIVCDHDNEECWKIIDASALASKDSDNG